MTRPDCYRGALLGLAVGDALGSSIEFQSRGSFEPLTEIKGGGPFRLKPGQWTDDTSLMLCLAESLIAEGDFNPDDQAARYLRWYREGYNSSTGRCFDIGHTTRTALEMYEQSGIPVGPDDVWAGGNGSLMRLAPIALRWPDNRTTAIKLAADSSVVTHAAQVPVDACRYFASVLLEALALEASPGDRSMRLAAALQAANFGPLHPDIAKVANGDFINKRANEIKPTGYAADTLEAALWAFALGESFEEAVLLAVNLGGDSDTIGAVTGQLAGAYYGASSIPPRWLEVLYWRDKIEAYADALYALANDEEPKPFFTFADGTHEDTLTDATEIAMAKEVQRRLESFGVQTVIFEDE